MPRVPSAPMNSLVMLNPADDLCNRHLVFITSPERRTTDLLCCPDIALNAQIDRCREMWGLTRRQWWLSAESPLACRNLITHFLRDNKLLNYELRSLSDVNHQPLCVDGLPRVLETAVGVD